MVQSEEEKKRKMDEQNKRTSDARFAAKDATRARELVEDDELRGTDVEVSARNNVLASAISLLLTLSVCPLTGHTSPDELMCYCNWCGGMALAGRSTALRVVAFWLVGPILLRKGSLTYTLESALLPPITARNQLNKNRKEHYETNKAERRNVPILSQFSVSAATFVNARAAAGMRVNKTGGQCAISYDKLEDGPKLGGGAFTVRASLTPDTTAKLATWVDDGVYFPPAVPTENCRLGIVAARGFSHSGNILEALPVTDGGGQAAVVETLRIRRQCGDALVLKYEDVHFLNMRAIYDSNDVDLLRKHVYFDCSLTVLYSAMESFTKKWSAFYDSIDAWLLRSYDMDPNDIDIAHLSAHLDACRRPPVQTLPTKKKEEEPFFDSIAAAVAALAVGASVAGRPADGKITPLEGCKGLPDGKPGVSVFMLQLLDNYEAGRGMGCTVKEAKGEVRIGLPK